MKKIFLGLFIIGALSTCNLQAVAPTYNKGFKARLEAWWYGDGKPRYSEKDIAFLKRGKREGVFKRYLLRGLVGHLTFGLIVNKTCWENGKFANFNGARLSDLTITDELTDELKGADFRYAKLEGVKFKGTNIEDADLSHATLDEVNFEDVNAKNARFHKAKFGPINIKNTDLTDANLSNIQTLRRADTVTVEKSNLINTDFTESKIANLSLDKTNGVGAIFDNARIERLKVETSDLGESSFFQTVVGETTIEKSNLSSASLVDAQLPQARMTDVWMSGADLTGTNLKESALIEFVHFEPRGPKCASLEVLGYQDPKKAPKASYWAWNPFQNNERKKFPFHQGGNDGNPALLVQTNLTKAHLIGVLGWKDLQEHSLEIFLVGAHIGPMAQALIQKRNDLLMNMRNSNGQLMGIFTNFMANKTELREVPRLEGYSVR